MPKSRTDELLDLIPKFLEAGLAGDQRRLELLSLTTIRRVKDENPELAKNLGLLLSATATKGKVVRWQIAEPIPADIEGGLALLHVTPVDLAAEPILSDEVRLPIDRLIQERFNSTMLLSEGFAPASTILLKGSPGTGKTMLAKWLAAKLNLRCLVLDLASSISSYLGKTGFNLRRSLDYARSAPCVLLLDEFDAIGKRRDDPGEVGELKRIVNVLLKELENWPLHSVLIAATNHPELLDSAIERRFDIVLEIPLPGAIERAAILQRSCGSFGATVSTEYLSVFGSLSDGMSGSEIETASRAAVRRHILEKQPLIPCLYIEISKRSSNGNRRKKEIGKLFNALSKDMGLTVRAIGELTGSSPSTVQYHIQKEKDYA